MKKIDVRVITKLIWRSNAHGTETLGKPGGATQDDTDRIR